MSVDGVVSFEAESLETGERQGIQCTAECDWVFVLNISPVQTFGCIPSFGFWENIEHLHWCIGRAEWASSVTIRHWLIIVLTVKYIEMDTSEKEYS